MMLRIMQALRLYIQSPVAHGHWHWPRHCCTWPLPEAQTAFLQPGEFQASDANTFLIKTGSAAAIPWDTSWPHVQEVTRKVSTFMVIYAYAG